jgi:predicted nucleotidyltransferase
MTRTALDMNMEEWKAYQPGLARAKRRPSQARRQKALDIAASAAEILRRDFGATRVVLFGSATNPGQFSKWSDIDLAAWGIAPERFYAAVGALMRLSQEFEIDLVDLEVARPEIRHAAETQGIEL